MRAVFVLVTLLFTSTAFAAMPAVQGRMYVEVRPELIAQGWEPFQTEDSDCINAGYRACKDFPEIRSCSSSGACKMTWRKDGEVITIGTFGDFNDVVAIQDGLDP